MTFYTMHTLLLQYLNNGILFIGRTQNRRDYGYARPKSAMLLRTVHLRWLDWQFTWNGFPSIFNKENSGYFLQTQK